MCRLWLTCILLSCGPLLLSAQDSAGISGRVLDPSGAVIAAAEVSLTNTASGSNARATTDQSGAFSFTGLAGGAYTLSASKPGFAGTKRDLQLQPGQSLTADIAMTLSSVGQSVSVNGGAPAGATLEPSQQQVFESDQTLRVLDRQQMDIVGPIAGAAQIVSVTPGANVTGYGNSGATKYTITLNGINQGWGGYGGFSGGASLGITFDGIPVVDPGTNLWQSPTIPQTAMIQDTKVVYGPGAPADRWYSNVGGSVEFTPVQPSNQPHGDVTLTYGSYNQRNIEFNLASGLFHGWSTVLSAGGGLGDDFRQGPDGFGNPSKDWAINNKTIKTFHDNDSFSVGAYFAHSGGYRSQVIPTTANPYITMNGQPGGPIYSQETSGFYSTLPYDSYNKYDTNEMGLINAKENIHLDSTTTFQNLSWYMHIGRLHNRLNDVYSPGPQLNEYNNPHTNTIGDQASVTKTFQWNTVTVGGYYIHALYNSRNNFYNPADGGGIDTVNIGGKIRSSYFNQDDFAIFVQDDFHPISILHITPGIRYVGFDTGYSAAVLQDFSFAPGVILSGYCPSNQIFTPGNTKNQSASCDNHQNRSGVEPSIDAAIRATPWLTLYGGFAEQLRSPSLGGGGGLFQSVDPASYHLARADYSQAGFKIRFEGSSGWRNGFLFGAAYYHTNYADQEIDVGLANGDTVSANGTSVYHGVNVFFEDNPAARLHIFVNGNVESANYTSYVTGGVSFNGSPVPYVPSSLLNAGAYYELRPRKSLVVRPMAAFQFVGSQHMFDNTLVAPSNQTMSSYGTLNLGVKVPFKFFELQLTALNVLNKKYNEYAYISSGGYFGTPTGGYTLAYPAAPFTVYGGVQFHF